MKSIILLALLGLISQSQAVQVNQRTVLWIRDEEDHSDEYFAAAENGMTPNGVEYTRALPEQFNEESSEKFMHKVLDEYALEKKTAKGGPSG